MYIRFTFASRKNWTTLVCQKLSSRASAVTLSFALTAPVSADDQVPQNHLSTSSTEPVNVDKRQLATITAPQEVSQTKQEKLKGNPSVLLKGQVTFLVPRGTPIKLKLASVPTSGLRLGDRDLDGNLPPAQLGQEITARTTEDIYVDNNKVIPEGTLFHGRVSQIVPPRRVGRPGSLVLSFNHLTTPDGKHFAFQAEANNFRPSTMKSKAKGLGIIAAHTAGGAILGALIAYQIFGLDNTIAAHGYNVAGGAAAGALAATAFAILRHGPQAVLEPGDDLNMEIDTDLLMPAATNPSPQKPSANLPGLQIQILKSKVKNDGLEGHYLYLDVLITNNSNKRLNSLDLFLEDDNGQRLPVCAGSEDNTELLFYIEPRSIKAVKFDLQLEYPKLKRRLIWLDRNSQTELFSQRLP